MLKTIVNMLAGAAITFAVSVALAVTGLPPGGGFVMPDTAWLLGLAGGTNFTFQSGITARASGTQATCVNLTPGVYLYEVDTVASTNDSVCVPFAQAGSNINIRNAGAQTMAVFAQPNTNLLTATTDTINGTTNTSAYTVPSNNTVECFAAKNGTWSCVKGS